LGCTFYEKINIPGSMYLKLEFKFKKKEEKEMGKIKRKEKGNRKNAVWAQIRNSAHSLSLAP
jgi:hypothetical protein